MRLAEIFVRTTAPTYMKEVLEYQEQLIRLTVKGCKMMIAFRITNAKVKRERSLVKKDKKNNSGRKSSSLHSVKTDRRRKCFELYSSCATSNLFYEFIGDCFQISLVFSNKAFSLIT